MRTMLKGGVAFAALATLASGGPAIAQTLKIWGPEHITDPVTAELWNELKADFEAENPGVTVEFTPPTGTISNGAVQAAIQSNAGPDLVLTNSGIGRVSIVADAKLVAPLTQYYEERGWKDQLFPWLYEDLKSQFSGEIYEVPDGLDVIGMWYHADMFEEHGWEIPNSYDGLLALFDDIREAGIHAIAVGPRNNANGGHLFGNLLQVSAGRETVGDVLSGQGDWTDPRMVDGAERLVELVEQEYVAPEMAGLDLEGATRLWFNKRAAFMIAGPWLTSNARQADFSMDKAAFTAMPSNLGAAESIPTGGVGWSWMLPVNSKQPELALEWLDFILSEEVMLKRARHPSSWMVYPRELPPFEPAIPALASVFQAANAGVGYNPSVYISGGALDTYFQVIQGLIGNLVSPDEGMAMIEAAAE